ncbi:hypothetical protein PMKS-001567 [Pichia membranifaciens]|uniref:Uncharacterized protein n=1 Tax=Pichia membranifaciens TaxID=4926 RepID=A0A1Q2YEY3_9ASCO|nr:hypothetical protein PMKS-001567 [Pichia membranifaciens]
MQFSVIASLALASLAAADTVLTQIGDGQIQAPTTENQQTTATATTTAPAETTTAPAETTGTETTSSEVPQFSNAAPKAVIGGGVVALAGLAALL